MEKLSVYEDYLQTMAFLHASKNRIVNAVETSRLAPESGKNITELCLNIYKQHTQRGMDRLRELDSAVRRRQEDALSQAMKALHKHNRQTMRISKVFEEDLSDTHPDPDADVVEGPKTPANLDIPLMSTKIEEKLQNLI